MTAYPKRLQPRVTRSALAIYGIGGVVGFALTFALAWFFPSAGVVWLAVAAGQSLFSLIFARKALLRSLVVLILTAAAVFAAAALH